MTEKKKHNEDGGNDFEVEELKSELDEVAGGACHCAGACSGGECSACCKEEANQQ